MTRFLVLVVAGLGVAADWPRFRGLNGAGVADADTPLAWAKSDIAWTVDLPGGGNGSPIVVAGKIFLQTAAKDGGKRHLACLDAATGQQLWATELGGKKAHTHAKNSLASGTPASDGKLVFVVVWNGATVALHAFDFAGKPVWDKPLGGFVSQHGPGHSPVVHGGKVFVNYDQDGKAEIVAFDAATGNKAWAAPRKAFRACYATPIVRDLPGGKAELVVATTAGLAGYDPDTGKVNWDWVWHFDGMALRTVGSPVLAGDLVIAISGDGGGSRHAVAVRPGPEPKLVWEKKKDSPYVPCPVVHGDYLYWVTDAGMATCLDAKTGEQKWVERLAVKSVSASLVLAGGAVLAVAEDGKAVAFKASPAGFEEVATAAVGEAVFASPAAAGGRLYLRSGARLICVGKK